ncbi:peptidoglycan-binding domain-containing protein [Frankia sp. Cr1]|nr:peptidoglycan-binding domain-containing protein [Frankia sp. Cr1]
MTLQRALRIPADGIFGPVTLRAVRNWQASHGFVVDDVVGPMTWASLGYR